MLGDLKAEGAARLSEAATEAALQSRSEEVTRAEAEVQRLLAALAARESQVAERETAAAQRVASAQQAEDRAADKCVEAVSRVPNHGLVVVEVLM